MKNPLSNNQILLQECLQQEFNESSYYVKEDNTNKQLQLNKFFELFGSSLLMKTTDVSNDDIEQGITGNGNDGGIDSMYILLDGEPVMEDSDITDEYIHKNPQIDFYIIQTKNQYGFKEDVVDKFKTVSSNLLDMSKDTDTYSKRYTEKVISLFNLFRSLIKATIRKNPSITFHYWYAANANEVHPNLQQKKDELVEVIQQKFPSAKCDVRYFGATELMNLYYSDTELMLTLNLQESPISLGSDNYVALINLPQFYNLIIDNEGQLIRQMFDANVRDYQGKNAVNTSIYETLTNADGKDFWWFNNGVTIICDKITPITQKQLTIQNPYIVNGLQTSTEIYNYYSRNESAITDDKRNILVRFLVPSEDDIRDKIIFATNNQTNIPKSALRATDPIHLQIETYFRNKGIYYDRRKNYYKNQRKNPEDIISVSFLAQCLISTIMSQPDYARARPSTILADEGKYKSLYVEHNELEVYYKIAVIGLKIRKYLKKQSSLSAAEQNDILFYVIFAYVATKLQTTHIDFDNIKRLDITSMSDNELNEIVEFVYNKYKQLGGNSHVAKSSKMTTEIIAGLFLQ